ncbi:MAG: discoidin domain-containing protein [Myxococcales bacterium]|nr:discoidin domain-containing protein [Myxococcales bacterium]
MAWLSAVREWFLLREAERLAEGCTDDARAEVRVLGAGIDARAKMAREAADEHFDAVSVVLLAQALELATSAVLIGKGELACGSVLGRAELIRRLESGELAELGLSESLVELAEIVASDDPSRVDRLEPQRRRDAIALLSASLKRVRKRYEVRTRRRIRVLRWLRLSGLGLLLLAMLTGGVVWALMPSNVARGKPVTASSVRAGTPSPGGLTDGEVTDGYGAHTENDGKAWFTVDLLVPHRIDRVIVHHRGDGYHSDPLPLALELSLDGQTFQRAALRDGTFTHKKPWRVKLGGQTARYVRLRVDRKDPNSYLALGEVEVYGKPSR